MIERNLDIQIFRGLAIAAVVFNHSCSNNAIFCHYIQAFVNFAVPLFIFLSGYLTRLHYENYYELIRRRVVRVLIPYIIWSLVYCVFLCENLSITRVLFYLLTGRACFPFYYIIVYIQFVLLAKWISTLAESRFSIIGYFLTPLYIILVRYFTLFEGISVPPLVSEILGISIVPWFSFFFIGLVLGNNHKWNGSNATIFLLALSILIQLFESQLLINLGYSEMAGSGNNISSFLTSLCMCLFCATFIKKEYVKKNRFTCMRKTLIVMGNCSFGVYLLHILVRDSVRIISYSIMSPFVEGLIVLIVSTLIVLGSNKLLPSKILNYFGF